MLQHLQHFKIQKTSGDPCSRIAVLLEDSSTLTIQTVAGHAIDLHILRKNPWYVEARRGQFGSRSWILWSKASDLLQSKKRCASLHQSMYDKLNDGLKMWIGDLWPLLEAAKAANAFNDQHYYIYPVDTDFPDENVWNTPRGGCRIYLSDDGYHVETRDGVRYKLSKERVIEVALWILKDEDPEEYARISDIDEKKRLAGEDVIFVAHSSEKSMYYPYSVDMDGVERIPTMPSQRGGRTRQGDRPHRKRSEIQVIPSFDLEAFKAFLQKHSEVWFDCRAVGSIPPVSELPENDPVHRFTDRAGDLESLRAIIASNAELTRVYNEADEQRGIDILRFLNGEDEDVTFDLWSKAIAER